MPSNKNKVRALSWFSLFLVSNAMIAWRMALTGNMDRFVYLMAIELVASYAIRKHWLARPMRWAAISAFPIAITFLVIMLQKD